MSMENPLWGAPRIHGELLKLGFEVAQSSVAKYMVKRWGLRQDFGGSAGGRTQGRAKTKLGCTLWRSSCDQHDFGWRGH